MITHGILTAYSRFDNLIHEMNEIEENDVLRENKKVNWTETRVFDNSNRGRSLSIYQGRWR